MAKQVKIKKSSPQPTKNKGRKSRLAYILAIIAFYFLIISGILAILMKDVFAKLFSEIAETEVSASYFVISGLIWLVLGFVVYTTVKKIENNAESSYKWFLFAISIIAGISGRLESAVLTFISSVIYLRKK